MSDELYKKLLAAENYLSTLTGEVKYWQDEIDNLDYFETSKMRQAQRNIENLWIERMEAYEKYEKLRRQIAEEKEDGN